MTSISWPYALAGAVLLLAVLWQSAVVYSMRAENCSDRQLRAMFASYGLLAAGLGFLLFRFGGGYRSTPFDDVFGILFMVTGPLMIIEALLISRDKLVNRTQLFTRSWWEVDLSDEAEVTPAERVRKLRGKG